MEMVQTISPGTVDYSNEQVMSVHPMNRSLQNPLHQADACVHSRYKPTALFICNALILTIQQVRASRSHHHCPRSCKS